MGGVFDGWVLVRLFGLLVPELEWPDSRCRGHPMTTHASVGHGRREYVLVGVVAAAILIIASFLLLKEAGGGAADIAQLGNDPGRVLAECRIDAMHQVGQEKPRLSELSEVASYCNSRVFEELKLRDMELRRLALLRQNSESPVLLWMVVTITISGVALSGLQLLASYHLAIAKGATLDGGGELTLESSKLAVKSSVTGLLILVTSFAFFLVFVLYVHKVNEVDPDKQFRQADNNSNGVPMTLPWLGTGGIGRPGPTVENSAQRLPPASQDAQRSTSTQ